jgi:hypothetical protein
MHATALTAHSFRERLDVCAAVLAGSDHPLETQKKMKHLENSWTEFKNCVEES